MSTVCFVLVISKTLSPSSMTHNIKVNYDQNYKKEQVSATQWNDSAIILVWETVHAPIWSDKKNFIRNLPHTHTHQYRLPHIYFRIFLCSQNENRRPSVIFTVVPFAIFHFLHLTVYAKLMHIHSHELLMTLISILFSLLLFRTCMIHCDKWLLTKTNFYLISSFKILPRLEKIEKKSSRKTQLEAFSWDHNEKNFHFKENAMQYSKIQTVAGCTHINSYSNEIGNDDKT